jgi:hypothetical protein
LIQAYLLIVALFTIKGSPRQADGAEWERRGGGGGRRLRIRRDFGGFGMAQVGGEMLQDARLPTSRLM